MSEADGPTAIRPVPALLSGALADRYEVIGRIGKGGFGEVWKVRDRTLNRLVAIKRLTAAADHDPTSRERLRREALAASALQHPNICTIHDLATAEGEYLLVLEYVEGRTIHDVLADGPLPPERAAAIAAQVANALEAAHLHGIIHRDIKSSNIVITPAWQAKVLDFGLAKQFANEEGGAFSITDMQLTQEGTAVGTLHYMSPEQLLGQHLDRRTDVFSLGVVLYEMLTGRLPFTGSSAASVTDAILHRDPAPLATGPIPSALQPVVLKALSKDRDQRFATAGEFAEDINKILGRTGPQQNRNRLTAVATAVAIVFVVLAWWWNREAPSRWARNAAMPEVESLLDRNEYAEAFRTAMKLQSIIPEDPRLIRAMEQASRRVTIDSTPPNAAVYWKRYGEEEARWERLGTTPLENIRFPRGLYLQLQARKEGYTTAHRLWPVIGATGGVQRLDFELRNLAQSPSGMVFIPQSEKVRLTIPGLDHHPPVTIPHFFIDEFEISNEQYQQFVDAGGYENEKYWREPFLDGGRRLSWRQAMSRFVDATGHPGPSTWELGTYPRGKGSLPVGGVSWFEAAAFAVFAGKRLPTIYHWNHAGTTQTSAVVAPVSNFSRKGPEPANTRRAMNGFGTFNMAGNVKEWSSTEAEEGKRYILGGGWDEPNYMFIDSDAQSPWSRRANHGFRCIRAAEPLPASITGAVFGESRDYSKEQPVTDELFRAYLGFYSYDRTPLDARVVSRQSSAEWTHEQVTMRAAYANEQLTVHIYLPTNARPPFQPVLHFPGSNAIHLDKFTSPGPYSDFVPRIGRALIFPIYKGTFERGDALDSDYPAPTSFYRDHLIAWTKDARRTIDYLETRPDIDISKLSLLGFSWGGVVGPIIAAIEPRIQACVFVVGGFCFQKTHAEVDQINFVPRVTQPTLMLNARYDHFYPLETSAEPMFRKLGTADEHKRLVLYSSGHALPRNEVIKETTAWLNRYLGPPQRP